MSDGDGKGRTPWLEIAIGGVGALMLALMVGYLAHDAFGGGAEERPADIVTELGEPAERAGGWRLPVLVRNTGDRPAEAAELRATLEPADGEVEETRLVVDFMPPRGTVDAVLLFERFPGAGELRLRATGYLEP